MINKSSAIAELFINFIMKDLNILLLMLEVTCASAQVPWPQMLNDYTCIDSASIEIRYEFKHKNHHTDKIYNEDVRLVQIGKNIIKECSEIIFHYDSLATENKKKNKDTYSIPYGTFPCEYYTNLREKYIDNKYRLVMDIGTLCYQTKLPNLVWDYSSDDITEISGYNCNKATTVYAGREYVAWYTLDVPVHYGPYKFSGLPGLIVMIEEKTGMYVWNLLSISTKTKEIYAYKYDNEQKTDEEKANKTIKKMMSNPYAFMQSAHSEISFRIPSKGGKLVPVPKEGIEQAYEPIEIE